MTSRSNYLERVRRMIRCHRKATAAVAFGTFCLLTGIDGFGQATPNQRIMIRPQPGTLLSAGCTVNELGMTFRTGNDDLRGGGNNLNVEIHLGDGSVQLESNVNKGQRWANNSSNTLYLALKQPLPPTEIRLIRLIHLAQGRFHPSVTETVASPIQGLAQGSQTEDNWDMLDAQIVAMGQAGSVPIASAGFYRFTGSSPSLDINARPGVTCPSPNQVQRLQFLFKTGNDDLRGGHDNLTISIFGDGLTQSQANVNQGQNWANGSMHEVHVYLDRPLPLNQIHPIRR